MTDKDKKLTLWDLLYVIFKHKGAIVVFTSACLVGAVLYSYAGPTKYEASARLLVEFTESSVDSEMGNIRPPRTSVITTISYSEKIRSEIELLESHLIAEGVFNLYSDAILNPPQPEAKTLSQKVELRLKQFYKRISSRIDEALIKIGLTERLSPQEKGILFIKKGLNTQLMKNSNVIKVSFRASSPELASCIVNEAVNQYLANRLVIHRTPNAVKFLEQQREEFKKQLKEAEDSLKEFKDKWQVAELETQIGYLLKLNADIRSELIKTDIEMERLKRRVTEIDKLAKPGDVNVTSATNPSEVIDTLKVRLMELKLKRIDMAMRYVLESPLLTTLDAEIADTESMLQREKAEAAVTVDIVSLESKRQKIEVLLEKSNAELKQITELQGELRRLERAIDLSEKLYSISYEKAAEARMQEAMEEARISNVRVIEQATSPILAVRTISFIPQRIFNIIMALIVGLFLSISIVAVMEIFDHSLKTAEDVEIYTGQPVLGTIPEKKSIRRRWSRFDRYKGLIATASLDSSKPAVVKPGPEKPNGIYFQLKKLYQGTIASELQRISDSLRTIRQNDGLGKCIMVSGSIPKEGVTVICLNLVQTIGKVCSGRILLVDLDFQCRKSKEIRNLKGLGDIILGGCTPADAIYPSDISNIFILPSVQTDYDSYEVVGSDAFGKLLEQLRREFEVIIIDAPPMQHYSESVITAGLADGVILVVSAERTRREVVNNTCSLVTKARGKIIGIILNRRRHYIPRFLYRHI